MENFIKLLNQDTTESRIQNSIEFIRKDIIQDINNKVYISEDIITCDIVQKYIFCNHDSFHDNIFQPIVISGCMQAESLSAGAGEITLFLISSMLKRFGATSRLDRDPRAVSKLLNSAQDASVEKILCTGHRATKRSTEQLLIQSINSDASKEMVNIALNLAGKNRKIFVKKTNHKDTKVFLTKGSHFKIKTGSEFLDDKCLWSNSDVRCIVIDGTIVEVSEIHHLLEKASESRLPYVIIARSFSPDVMNTILVNKMRGVLDVIPIETGMNEDTVNILSDIATVCGCDVVSSLKGELISSAVKEDLAIVDKIKIDQSGIQIENKKTARNILMHVNMIEKKKSECDSNELYDLLDKRVSSLLSGNVSIAVGTDLLSRDPQAIEQIDRFLRLFFSHIGFGYITVSEIRDLEASGEIVTDDLILFLHEKFKEGIVPVSSIISSIKISISVVKNMLSIGSILVRDV